jgi:phosphatidate phosphatase APP1
MPKAVLILRKMKYKIYQFRKSGGGNHELKYEKIKFLLQFYKTQKFILIGDSGQRDPQIYKRLALEFPGRIEAIYIRKVKSKMAGILSGFHEELLSVNTSFIEIADSSAAMNHAREAGLIQ